MPAVLSYQRFIRKIKPEDNEKDPSRQHKITEGVAKEFQYRVRDEIVKGRAHDRNND